MIPGWSNEVREATDWADMFTCGTCGVRWSMQVGDRCWYCPPAEEEAA